MGGDRWFRCSRQLAAPVLAAVLLCAGPAPADLGGEFLPTDHWANQYIYELYASGVWGNWPIGTRPWSRGDISERLALVSRRDSTEHHLTRAERHLIARLLYEFSDDMAHSAAESEMDLRAGGELFGSSSTEPGTKPVYRGRVQAFAATGTGLWWARMRGDLDSHGELDPTFFGEEWKDKFTGTVDVAYFTLRSGGFELAVGRDYLRWGSSPYDVLLLNDQSPPFDMARFVYHHRLFDFSFFFTGLDSAFAHPADSSADTAPEVKRYLSGHRIEVRPASGLALALSEVVVYGGAGRQLEAYYLNPFLPYYWEQLNADTDDNPLWSLDVSWRIPRGPMLYGEWLIDDFQADFKSEPNQVGWTLGFNWAALPLVPGSFVTFDWTHLEPSVYRQVRPYNRYLNHRVGMGSVLGTDAERYLLYWRQHLTRSLDGSLRGQLVRRGEGEIDFPLESPIPDVGFPSGVVEATTEAELGVFYQPSRSVRFELRAGYRWRENADHVQGSRRDGGFVSASVAITDWLTGSF